jgi:hypothetical protein
VELRAHCLTTRDGIVVYEPRTFSVEVRNDGHSGPRLYVSVEGQDTVYGPLSMAELGAVMDRLARGVDPLTSAAQRHSA